MHASYIGRLSNRRLIIQTILREDRKLLAPLPVVFIEVRTILFCVNDIKCKN
jgi:hypothetical protein